MLSVVMLLVLSAFAIHSSISSGRRSPDVASPRLRSPPKPSTSAGVSDRPPIALPPVNLEMIEMLHKGHSPSEILETFQSQQQQPPSPSSSSSLTLTLTTPRQTEEDELLAKWKAVEIFKVPKAFALSSLRLPFFLDHHQLFASDRRGYIGQRGLDRGTDRPVRNGR